jgi:hypothetical protein
MKSLHEDSNYWERIDWIDCIVMQGIAHEISVADLI